MPVYIYRHTDDDRACAKAPEFRWEQPSNDFPISKCPWCGGSVERVIGAPRVKDRKFDCELRDMGFTKLVRVDDGIFENVTRRDGETRYYDRRRPETCPVLEKTIKD
ncbi:MAG: zinc ribbon domain-containing protein [Deltaproteobacteria bacterium]|jgi:hypothetical protein|nr:zinc ribbon domain-containing protein [Deltaproteobacteria bacterium]